MATINDPNTSTNVQTVKAGSTAAAAADMPAVVTIHPNSVAPGATLTTTTGAGGAGRISPWGEQRVQPDATQLFIDTFDSGPIDTTNTWSAPTTSGSGTAFAFSTASMTGGTGTTANSFSMIASQATFQPSAPGFLEFQTNINIEFPVLLNAVRFWGLATAPGSPTAALPLTNAMGFFVDLAGKLWAVTYQSGTRVNIQDLSSSGNNKQPLDSSAHKYYVYIRGDVGYWAIDDRDNVVATMPTGANGPDVTSLPIRYLAVAGAVAPASTATLVVNATVLGDTAGNNIAICDAQFPWRQAFVKAPSTSAVATDSALVIAISPNMPATPLPQNLTQVASSAVSTAAAGVQKVGIVGNVGAAVDAVAGAAAPANVVFTSTAQIGATAVSTAAAGVQKVGIVGNANASVDAVQGAAPPANLLWTEARLRASDLFVTNTAAVNTGFTLTLPAAGAGLFHYITSIEVTRATNATATAAGAALTITTTNLPGAPVWTFGNASVAGGTTKLVDFSPTTPLKSSVANTATTIVVPAAGAGEILRVNVSYYAAL